MAARGLACALLLAIAAGAWGQPAGPGDLLPALAGWSPRVDLAVASVGEWTGGDATLRRSLAEAGVVAFVQATYRDRQGHLFRVALYRHASTGDALRAVLAASRLLAAPARGRIREVSFLDGRRVVVQAGVFSVHVTALTSADSLYALAASLAAALAGEEP